MKYLVSIMYSGKPSTWVEVEALTPLEAAKKHPVKPLRHHEVKVEGGDLKEPEYYEVGRI